jgi:hypothetical protein
MGKVNQKSTLLPALNTPQQTHTSSNSSLVGVWLSERLSSMAFLNSADWATMMAVILVIQVDCLVSLFVGEKDWSFWLGRLSGEVGCLTRRNLQHPSQSVVDRGVMRLHGPDYNAIDEAKLRVPDNDQVNSNAFLLNN